MTALSDFQIFLPKYLSADSITALFKELTAFPSNIESRYYTLYLADSKNIYQGDGISSLPRYDFQAKQEKPCKGVVISNSCDIDPDNRRFFSPFITFAPLFNLSKYQDALLKAYPSRKDDIDNHVESIRQQRVTQFFYLPAKDQNDDELFARLDLLFSIPASTLAPEKLVQERLFTLSDFGFYIFLFKVSVHFSRIQEAVERKMLLTQ